MRPGKRPVRSRDQLVAHAVVYESSWPRILLRAPVHHVNGLEAAAAAQVLCHMHHSAKGAWGLWSRTKALY